MMHSPRANQRLRFRRSAGISGLLALVFLVGGCADDEATRPSRVTKVSGDSQCGFPGEILPEPLVVRVLGPRSRDLLGRRGSRPPGMDVDVTFRVERLADYRENGAAEEGDSEVLRPYPLLLSAPNAVPAASERKIAVRSDKSGLAKIWVQLGTLSEDWRIEAIVEGADGRVIDKEHFRIVSGVRKSIQSAESTVGSKVDIGLELASWSGDPAHPTPLAKRVVFFRVVSEPLGYGDSATLSNRRDETDAKGVRGGTTLTLGDEPGVYRVLAEIEPFHSPSDEPSRTESDEPLRGILFEVVAQDWYKVAVNGISGVLLFLIGVRFLSGGFLLLFSPRLHFESGPWTQNPVVGYLGGTLIGATSQSWSTVSANLVSFVNGGLLTARGGAMLLLGASLGATVLPQFLSLELGFLTVPFLALGIFCLFLPRGKGMNSAGWVFLGGGLVLASWTQLTNGTELLGLSNSFRSYLDSSAVDFDAGFAVYTSRTLAVFFTGVILGFLLRTSNLIVIVSIVLASRLIIGAETCVPVIVGANVGSAILLFVRTAFKRREARRLAAAGLVFHLATAAFVLVLSVITIDGYSLYLWIVDAVTPGELFYPTPESLGHHLAMSHTLYNLLGGAIFLMTQGLLFRVVDRVVRPDSARTEVKPQSLDSNLIPVPSLALRQVRQEVIYMTELVQKTVGDAFDSFRYADPQLGDQVVRREETVAGIHRDVSRYLVLVGENQLARYDASTLEILQSTSSALTRIAEYTELIQELATRRVEEKVESTEETDKELSEVYDLVISQFDNIITLLGQRDPKVEENVMKMVERLAKSRTRLETQWRQRIEKSESEWGTGVRLHIQASIFQEAFNLLFRVGSDLAHVAQQMRLLSPDRL